MEQPERYPFMNVYIKHQARRIGGYTWAVRLQPRGAVVVCWLGCGQANDGEIGPEAGEQTDGWSGQECVWRQARQKMVAGPMGVSYIAGRGYVSIAFGSPSGIPGWLSTSGRFLSSSLSLSADGDSVE